MPGIERAAKRFGFEWLANTDRRLAIEHAIRQAKSGDVVLLAGKGHEDYQEVKGVKHHFMDAEEADRVLSEMYGAELM